FQAEDGIRDFHVTGVQTCALPIWMRSTQVLPSVRSYRVGCTSVMRRASRSGQGRSGTEDLPDLGQAAGLPPARRLLRQSFYTPRSEERRVGKECRSRWAADAAKMR